MEFMMIR